MCVRKYVYTHREWRRIAMVNLVLWVKVFRVLFWMRPNQIIKFLLFSYLFVFFRRLVVCTEYVCICLRECLCVYSCAYDCMKWVEHMLNWGLELKCFCVLLIWEDFHFHCKLNRLFWQLDNKITIGFVFCKVKVEVYIIYEAQNRYRI